MTMLLAHHLEPHHLGIAFALFAAGSMLGWMGCSRWFAARERDRRAS